MEQLIDRYRTELLKTKDSLIEELRKEADLLKSLISLQADYDKLTKEYSELRKETDRLKKEHKRTIISFRDDEEGDAGSGGDDSR